MTVHLPCRDLKTIHFFPTKKRKERKTGKILLIYILSWPQSNLKDLKEFYFYLHRISIDTLHICFLIFVILLPQCTL